MNTPVVSAFSATQGVGSSGAAGAAAAKSTENSAGAAASFTETLNNTVRGNSARRDPLPNKPSDQSTGKSAPAQKADSASAAQRKPRGKPGDGKKPTSSSSDESSSAESESTDKHGTGIDEAALVPTDTANTGAAKVEKTGEDSVKSGTKPVTDSNAAATIAGAVAQVATAVVAVKPAEGGAVASGKSTGAKAVAGEVPLVPLPKEGAAAATGSDAAGPAVKTVDQSTAAAKTAGAETVVAETAPTTAQKQGRPTRAVALAQNTGKRVGDEAQAKIAIAGKAPAGNTVPSAQASAESLSTTATPVPGAKVASHVEDVGRSGNSAPSAIIATASGVFNAPPVHAALAGGVAGAPTGSTTLASGLSTEAAFAANNLAQIAGEVRTQLLPNGGSMQIRLDPPELGALQVRIEVRDGVVNASFQTSNDEATRLLSHSLGQLKDVLQGQGVTVEKLQVQQMQRSETFSGGQPQHDQSNAHAEQQHQQEQQRREMMQRLWRRLSLTGDPLDLVA